jgi:hypothetical protein
MIIFRPACIAGVPQGWSTAARTALRIRLARGPNVAGVTDDADIIGALCAEFPEFRIWTETPPRQRPWLVAQRERAGVNPVCVITRDPGELRAALAQGRADAAR